jgi:hypothetical protein
LPVSAISRPWQLHLNFSCEVESNGWFSAINLIARISGPGHDLPVAHPSFRPLKRLLHFETCQTAYADSSANPAIVLMR